jgi:hypothetical protein
VGPKQYADLNPELYDCVGGGPTDSGITWCVATPSGGLIALIIIVPLIPIVTCCCFCCRACPGYKRMHRGGARAAARGRPRQQMVFMSPTTGAMGTTTAAVGHPVAYDPRMMMMAPPQLGVPVRAPVAAQQQRRATTTRAAAGAMARRSASPASSASPRASSASRASSPRGSLHKKDYVY